MGNTAMCKVCGSDKGLRTMASLSALGQNDLPDFYCEEHFPAWSPLVLVRGHTGRCSRHCWTVSTSSRRSLLWCFESFFSELAVLRAVVGRMYARLSNRCQLFPAPSQLFLFRSQPGWLQHFGFVIDRLLSLHELFFGTITCLLFLV